MTSNVNAGINLYSFSIIWGGLATLWFMPAEWPPMYIKWYLRCYCI